MKKNQLRKFLVCIMVFAMIVSQGTVFGYNDFDVDDPVLINTDNPEEIDTNAVDGDAGELTEPGDGDDVIDFDDEDGDVVGSDDEDGDVIGPDDDGDDVIDLDDEDGDVVDPDDDGDDDVDLDDGDDDVVDPDDEDGDVVNPDDGIEIDDEEVPEGELSDDEDADELDEEEQEEEAVELIQQTLTASIYTGETCEEVDLDDETVITVTGELPEGAYINAYAVEVELEDSIVLAAYDITIYNADGEVFEPESAVEVNIILPEEPELEEGEEISIVHVPEVGEPEAVEVVETEVVEIENAEDITATGFAITFEVEHFSVYAVTITDISISLTLQSGSATPTNFTINGKKDSSYNTGNAKTIIVNQGDPITISFTSDDQLQLNGFKIIKAGSESITVPATGTVDGNTISYTLSGIGNKARVMITYKVGDATYYAWINFTVTTEPQPIMNNTNTDGITINLFNYGRGINSNYSSAAYPGFFNGNSADHTIENPGGGSANRHNADGSRDKMTHTLVNGYPHFNNVSLQYLFDSTSDDLRNDNGNTSTNAYTNRLSNGGNYTRKAFADVKGLLQQDDKGYYYYDSMENSAFYNQNTNRIELFEHLVHPYNGSKDGDIQISNFLPFTKVNYSNPKAGTTVLNGKTSYTARERGYSNVTVDYVTDLWFGMDISFDFLQPANGKLNNEAMVFEFSGDDDVFVYIDDVLVINLFGTHAAQSATIDFNTGMVTGGQNKGKTLRAIFEAAGADMSKFNAGSYTFADWTKHNLKFYYMERGGNISYCKVRFNLPAMPDGELNVGKIVDGVDPLAIADQEFKMQLFIEDVVQNNTDYVLQRTDNTSVTLKTDSDGVFVLKHNERAKFKIQDGQKFYVKELDLGKITNISGVQYDLVTTDGGTTRQDAILNPDGTVTSEVYTYNYKSATTVLNMYNTIKNPAVALCDIVLEKKFDGSIKTAPNGFDAEFYVYRQLVDEEGKLVVDEDNDPVWSLIRTISYSELINNGSLTMQNMLFGNYKIEEVIKGSAALPCTATQATVVGDPEASVTKNINDAKIIFFTIENVNSEEGSPNEKATVTFTNYYGMVPVDITIIKLNDDEPPIPLAGVKFKLYKVGNDSQLDEGSTDNDGKIVFVKLAEGLYYLEEDTPPDGYAKLENLIYFKITDNQGTASIMLTDANGDALTGDALKSPATLLTTTITIVNHRLIYNLPLTGGIGTTIFTIAGIAIIGTALVSIVIYFRRGGRKKAKTGK